MHHSREPEEDIFSWPEGKRAALSLSFDDGRPSQLDNAIPILDDAGLRATFYVAPGRTAHYVEQWREAAERGHEIGSHTVHHPCSANFTFSSGRDLESYDLDRMEAELLEANRLIRERFSVNPVTFAYPCGQTFVGRGVQCRSYVPLVARHYVVGRGFKDESANDPRVCDLAQVMAMEADDTDLERLQSMVSRALARGRWLVLAAHDVGTGSRQTLHTDVLRRFSAFVSDPELGLWVDTLAAVGAYVRDRQDPALHKAAQVSKQEVEAC